MADIYKILGTAVPNLWNLPSRSDIDDISATEYWLDHTTDKVKVEPRKVKLADQDAWLKQRTRGAGSTAQSLLARLVWVVADQNKPGEHNISLSSSVQQRLLSEFGLKLAHTYFKTFSTGITALPPASTAQSDHQRAYAFCYGPKYAAIWSHKVFADTGEEPITQGLLFARKPKPKTKQEQEEEEKEEEEEDKAHARKSPDTEPKLDELQRAKRLIESPVWPAYACRSAAFPAYLFSIIQSVDITGTQNKISRSLKRVETETGYHLFQSRAKSKPKKDKSEKDKPKSPGQDAAESPGKDETKSPGGDETKSPRGDEAKTAGKDEKKLGKLSVQASGSATKLASVTRKSKVVGKLLDFIEGVADEEMLLRSATVATVNPAGAEGAQIPHLKFDVGVLRERLETQIVETEYSLKRAQIQIEALFNLMSQEDSMNNYELARFTRDISLTTLRDAASMKTLAVVTMFFLPGSFVSALFSTDLFSWDTVDVEDTGTIGVGTTPQFKLYWAVTIPLTLVTFLLYFLWLWWIHEERKKHNIGHRSPQATTGRSTSEGQEEEEEEEEAVNETIMRKRATLISNPEEVPGTRMNWRRRLFGQRQQGAAV